MQLPSSFEFIQSHLPLNTKGLGITTLSKRNFFQSIGDYFAEKSGKNRVSYVAVGDDFITLLHFQGTDLIDEKTIKLDQLDHFYVSEGQTADGIIHHLSCDATVIISEKKMLDHHVKILPCLLGENASNVQAIQSIQWAQESKKNITDILKGWPELIAKKKAKLAEENA
ncbi:hypothetical protein [Aquirufa novilacunae]|jgi:hypothetical protein|uniref:Uncharacterized protein n=1 Tax=Aquirufa novilacunae TaxID=3139305 RepID=A0ABW8TXT0_9BACT